MCAVKQGWALGRPKLLAHLMLLPCTEGVRPRIGARLVSGSKLCQWSVTCLLQATHAVLRGSPYEYPVARRRILQSMECGHSTYRLPYK